jgi:hypothetical protein
MWSIRRIQLGGVLAAAVLATACAQPAPTPAEPVAAPVPAPAPVPRTGLPGPVEPGLEQTNPDGVSVLVERIAFEPDRILVDLVVTNGSRGPVALASSPYTGMTLRDDRGGSYNFQVPAKNKALRVAPGESYQAQIVFAGALPLDATTLALTTNAGADADPFVPRFEFSAIPVG